MSNKPKSIDISGVKYASANELDENYNFLERLVDAGKVGKVTWNGLNYYEVDAVKKATTDLRTIPPGYVRAVDHAILLGSDSRVASELCNKTNAPAKKVLVNGTKPAWFVDKAWFEKQLGVKPAAPAPAKPAPKAKGKAPVVTTIAPTATIQELQATIAELRTAIQNITRGNMTPKTSEITEDVAREQGYRPLTDLAKELEVDPGTLRGWGIRGTARSYKIGGRVFLNVEDCERMYLKLDDNRAMILGRMGGKTKNGMLAAARSSNGVS